jgi:hypothetical protein
VRIALAVFLTVGASLIYLSTWRAYFSKRKADPEFKAATGRIADVGFALYGLALALGIAWVLLLKA